MPLKVELSDVFTSLYKRLRIKQSSAQNVEPSYLPESINLVYTINGLVDEKVNGLLSTEFFTGLVNISVADLTTIYHFPKGYNYILRAVSLQLETGDYLCSSFWVGLSPTFSLVIWTGTAAKELYTNLLVPLPLPGGYELIVSVSSLTLAGNARYKILFSRQLP